MVILGLSAFYHDSAAALVVDGTIIAAVQEERFTRIKHDHQFPEQSVRYCLQQAGLTLDSVDLICFYEKPFIKFERLLETYISYAPFKGFFFVFKCFADLVAVQAQLKVAFKKEVSTSFWPKLVFKN